MNNPTANTLSLSPMAGSTTTGALELSGTIIPVEDSFIITENGDQIITEDGNPLITE